MKSIFVSSTFKDMHAERDVMQTQIIPELNLYARSFGEELRFVDLRWGVNTGDLETEEGSRKVLSICLDEIDSCKPYMIIILGDRYGWVPEKALLEHSVKNKDYEIDDFQKSVTALEIEYGALSKHAIPENCLFFFRESLPYADMSEQEYAIYQCENEEYFAKLNALKERIKAEFGEKVVFYKGAWDNENSRITGLETFAEEMIQGVKNLMNEEFEKSAKLTWQQRESLEAKLFCEGKCRQFSARQELISQYSDEILDEESQFFAISGEAGSGKSTLICRLSQELKERKNNVFTFISGSSSQSSTAANMVRQIVFFLEEKLQKETHFEDSTSHEKSSSPNDGVEDSTSHEKSTSLKDWVDEFMALAIAYEGKFSEPLVIICDALDQLDQDEAVQKYLWLPEYLPPCVKIVVSHLSDFKALLPHRYEIDMVKKSISSLTDAEKEEIIQGILKSEGKEIDRHVMGGILKKQGSDNPLYLSLVVQRLLMFDSEDFAEITRHGNDMNAITTHMLAVIEGSPQSLTEMAAQVMLEASERLNKEQSDKVLALLAIARNGLRESDLAGIFTSDSLDWSSLDLSLLLKYMHKFFALRDDGRIDFTHKSIRFGLAEHFKPDFVQRNTQILEWLKTLDHRDTVKIREIVYHAYKNDDKAFVAKYIEEVTSGTDAFCKKMTAEEIHKISMNDAGEWFIELINNAEAYGCENDFIDFCNFNIQEAFEKSMDEMNMLLSIMEAVIQSADGIAEKLGTPSAYRGSFISYHKIGNILKAQGHIDATLEYYNKSLEIKMRLAKQLKTPEIERDLFVSYYDIGNILKKQGNTDESLEYYNKSLEIAERLAKQVQTPGATRDLSVTYDQIGQILQKQGHIDESLKYHNKSLEIFESLAKRLKTPETEWDLYVSYSNIGNIFQAHGDIDKALEYSNKSLEIAERLAKQSKTPKFERGLAFAYERVGNILETQGHLNKSLEYYNKSLEIFKHLATQLETPQSNLDLEMINEAIILALKEQAVAEQYSENEANPPQDNNDLALEALDEAITCVLEKHQKDLEIAINIFKKGETSQDKRDLAISYKDLGDILKAQENIEQALEYYNKYLEIAESLNEGVLLALKEQDNAEQSSNEITPPQDNNEQAFEKYQKDLEIAVDIFNQIKTPEAHRNLFINFFKMGFLFAEQKKFTEALENYNQALEIAEQLAGQLRTLQSYEELAAIKQHISHTLKEQDATAKQGSGFGKFFKGLFGRRKTPQSNLGLEKVNKAANRTLKEQDVAEQFSENEANPVQDNIEQAVKEAQKALKIAEKLAKKLKTPEASKDLAVNYMKVAEIFQAQGEIDKALEYYDKGLEVFGHLANHLKTARGYRELAVMCDLIGEIFQKHGDLNKTLDYYEKGLGIFESLAVQLETPEAYRDLSLGYGKIGQIFQTQGNFEQALDYYKKYLEIAERLANQLETPRAESDLSISYLKVGEILQAQGEIEQALKYYNKYLEIIVRLAKQLETPEAYRDLFLGYFKVGYLLAEQEIFAEALENYHQALEIAEQLAEQLETPQSKLELEMINEAISDLLKKKQSAANKSSFVDFQDTFKDLFGK